MTPAAPPINASVTVDVAGWAAPRRTRVEDLDGDVVVAAPSAAGDEHAPDPGTVVEICWQGDRGPTSLRSRFVVVEGGAVPLWRLSPDGPVQTTQRRDHVRAGALLPVVLHTCDGHLDAHAVDLSEGGLRVVCPVPAGLVVGDRLVVELQVAARRLALASEVVRLDADRERCVAGCRFTAIAEGEADAVRRFVFDRQARERVRP